MKAPVLNEPTNSETLQELITYAANGLLNCYRPCKNQQSTEFHYNRFLGNPVSAIARDHSFRKCASIPCGVAPRSGRISGITYK